MIFILLVLSVLGKLDLPLTSRSLKDFPNAKNRGLQGSSLNLDNYGTVYTIECKIGTPSTAFSLLVDTGSLITWVELESCKNCDNFSNQFNPTSSYTHEYLGITINETYHDSANFTGELGTDIIALGADGSLSVRSYMVVATEDYDWNSKLIDGVLALGAMSASPLSYPSIIATLKENKYITSGVFALYLGVFNILSNKLVTGNPASNLEIGGYDLKKYSAGGVVTAVFDVLDQNDAWNVYFQSISLGNTTIDTAIFGFVDSGYSLIYAAYEGYTALINYMTSSASYSCQFNSVTVSLVCKCASTDSMPDLTFADDTYNITASRKYLWYYNNNTCTLLVQRTTESGSWTLGQALLANYYTIFDLDNSQISFAPAVQATAAAQLAGLWLATIISLIFS